MSGAASAERPEQAPAEQAERPAAERPVAAPVSEDGGERRALALDGHRSRGWWRRRSRCSCCARRLPFRKPRTTVVPLGRGLALEGESRDPDIGRFRGTAYAVEIPEVKDAEQRAERSRFFVLDPGPPAAVLGRLLGGAYAAAAGAAGPSGTVGRAAWAEAGHPGARLRDGAALGPRAAGRAVRAARADRGPVQAAEVRAPRSGPRRRAERRGRARATRRAVRARALRRTRGECPGGGGREPARRLAAAARRAARTSGRGRDRAGGARAGARHLHGGGPRAGPPAGDRSQRAVQARRRPSPDRARSAEAATARRRPRAGALALRDRGRVASGHRRRPERRPRRATWCR